MVNHVVVTGGRTKNLGLLVDLEVQRSSLGMLGVPVVQVLFTQLLRPPADSVIVRFGPRVLRCIGHGRLPDDQSAFGPVEPEKLSLIIVQIAAHRDPEVRVVVESLDQIREVPSVLVVKQTSRRLCAQWNSVGPGYEMNSRKQVNKKITTEPGAVISEAAPTEKADGIKRSLRRPIEKCIPVDGLFVCVGRNGTDKRPPRRIPVPICLDRIDIT